MQGAPIRTGIISAQVFFKFPLAAIARMIQKARGKEYWKVLSRMAICKERENIFMRMGMCMRDHSTREKGRVRVCTKRKLSYLTQLFQNKNSVGRVSSLFPTETNIKETSLTVFSMGWANTRTKMEQCMKEISTADRCGVRAR